MAKQESIGALWIEQTRDGAEYFKGSITIAGVTHRISVFRNGYRTETNRQPHYRIMPSTGAPVADHGPAQAEPRAVDTRSHADRGAAGGELSAEDIPF